MRSNNFGTIKKITSVSPFRFVPKRQRRSTSCFEYINIISYVAVYFLSTVHYYWQSTNKQPIDLWNLLGKLGRSRHFKFSHVGTCIIFGLRPSIKTSGGVQATGTYHPLLSEVVMNDVAWTHTPS